jgi:hypothetical protein
MKHLKVEYNGIVLFDGDVEEVTWNENGNGVSVSGKIKTSNSGGLLDLLTAASKKQTANAVELKRTALENEKAAAVMQEGEHPVGVPE